MLAGLGALLCLAGLLVYLSLSMPSFKQKASPAMRSAEAPPAEPVLQTEVVGVHATDPVHTRAHPAGVSAAVADDVRKDRTGEKSVEAEDTVAPADELPPVGEPARSGRADSSVAQTDAQGSTPGGGLIGRQTSAAPVEYYLYSGYEREKKGNPAEALFFYKKAAAAHPSDCKLLNKIGALLISLELYDDAVPYLESALEVNEDYCPALINMGILAARTGRPEDAQRHLAAAISLDSTNRDALYTMMQLCRMQGDYTRAGTFRAKLQSLGFSVGQ